jgi:hypothetical protein
MGSQEKSYFSLVKKMFRGSLVVTKLYYNSSDYADWTTKLSIRSEIWQFSSQLL